MRETPIKRTWSVSVSGNRCWVRHDDTVYRCERPDGLHEYSQDDMTVTVESGPDTLGHDEVRYWAHDAFLDAYGCV